MTKKGGIFIGIMITVVAAYFLIPVKTSPSRSEPGMPRYDIVKELRTLEGKLLTGYFVQGGLKVSNRGRVSSRDLIMTRQIVGHLRNSRTTIPEYISQGQKLNAVESLYRGQCIGITYMDRLQERSLVIPTIPGAEEQLFGLTCGQLIKELWRRVSD